ncbi:hypothetical protein HK098_005093 [Nowakowskiella sp. JEL0407]|nr:hypothetical protein HK098_005093 [Nowakowskiella sp. JEL0407]
MAYLHSQTPPILHGDLKASNCLITIGVLGTVIKLSDFGLDHTRSDTISRSLFWMAPERLRGDRPTKSSDVYSFSMTAYEILSIGKLPFELNGLQDNSIVNAIYNHVRPVRPLHGSAIFNVEQWDLVERCWHNDPTVRPTFDEILVLLESIQLNLTQSLSTPSSGRQSRSPLFYAAISDHSSFNSTPNRNDVSLLIAESPRHAEIISNVEVQNKNFESASLISSDVTDSYVATNVPYTNRLNQRASQINVGPQITIEMERNIRDKRKPPPIKTSLWRTRCCMIFAVIVGILIIGGGIALAIVFGQSKNQSSPTTPGTIVRKYSGHTGRIWSLAVLQDDPPRLFSGSFDNTTREWNLTTGNTVRTFTGHDAGIYSLSLLPGNPPRLFTGSADKTVREWDLSAGKWVRTYSGSWLDVQAVTVLPGTPPRLFSGSWDNTTREWDTTTGLMLRNFTGQKDSVLSLAVLPGRLFSGGSTRDTTIREWDLSTGKNVRTYTGHTAYVEYIAVLQGSAPRMFSCSSDKTIREWDLNTGESIRTFYGHSSYVLTLAVLQGNPPRLFSGSADNTIREWDINTGETVRVYEGHNDAVRAIALLQGSPARMFSAGNGQTIIEWII